MLEGNRPDACTPCWRVEDLGGLSYRKEANKTYPVDPALQATITPEPNFEFVDLRFGNICNLACRMCIPYSSKKMIPEYQELYGEERVKPYLKLDWFESEGFWDDLFKYSKNVKRIHLAGGEPLLIKQCWKFLKRLIDAGLSKNLVLSYNTNLTVLPPEAKDVWPHFKEVHVIASMDGVGKINEFIRYPLIWTEFEANLRELDTNFKAYNLAQFQIHATVQVYNVKRIAELCDYVTTSFQNIKKIPTFDIVYGPEELDPQVLPAFYREEAAFLIEEYILKLSTGLHDLHPKEFIELLKNLRSITRHLRGGDKSEKFHEFKRLNDTFDRNRKHRTFDYIPELERAYDNQQSKP